MPPIKWVQESPFRAYYGHARRTLKRLNLCFPKGSPSPMKQERIFFDSHHPRFRKPFGAVPCSTKVTLQLQLAEPAQVVFVEFRGIPGHDLSVPMSTSDQGGSVYFYAAEVEAPPRPGLWYYFFKVCMSGCTWYYGNNPALSGGVGQAYDGPPPAYQMTVFRESPYQPVWFQDAVVYQIFVDRFFNGCETGVLNPKPKSLIHGCWNDNPVYLWDKTGDFITRYDFFGGNLLGIIKKLPYLKELGISALYLNPIFDSPSNHKYDTSDYKRVDPMFGDNKEFRKLCKRAAKLGIHIILDGVFSHTGSDSVYFNKKGNYPGVGAYQSKDSPYFTWYKFEDYPDKYHSWWGHDTLPEVNELDPSYMDFIIHNDDSVVKYWLNMGAKGWRLDVADELPDEFIKHLKTAMKEADPESILIGEVWEDASNKVSYGELREYFWGDELDSVMNYPFRSILIDFILGKRDARAVHAALMSLYENYPRFNFYNCLNLVGSHDLPRLLTILGEAPSEQQLSTSERERYRLDPDRKALGLRRMKLISLFQMTFPGVPCVYYGDEAGMEGYSDPHNRGPFPWDNINRDLLAWYQKIIALRNENEVFRRGDWYSLAPLICAAGCGNDLFGYIRHDKKNAALVLLNRNPGKAATLRIDLNPWGGGNFYDALKESSWKSQSGLTEIAVPPLEGKVLLSR